MTELVPLPPPSEYVPKGHPHPTPHPTPNMTSFEKVINVNIHSIFERTLEVSNAFAFGANQIFFLNSQLSIAESVPKLG